MKIAIHVLNTDLFFKDSPNTGEDSCLCSRCHRKIEEGEDVLRVACEDDDFRHKPPESKEYVKFESAELNMGGYEFRLCVDCQNNLR